MRILFLTDNFPPEVNAPANRTYEHCREWVKKGVEVTVITCAPNFPIGKVYEGYRNRLYQKEIMEGIKVIRVWSYISANAGLFRRTMDYISYGITAFLAGLFVRTDIIIATSPQFFTTVSGAILAFFKRKKWVMEVRDLWPESIIAVGAMKRNRIINIFEWMEKRLYHSADHIIVVTDAFKEKITLRGLAPEKISIFKNGVNLLINKPSQKPERLIQKHGLEGKLIIAYIGTLGMAHGLDFILQTLNRLKEKFPNITFLFLGDGAEKNNLIEKAEELNLENVVFVDSVSKDEVLDYLNLMDVALVNLKKSDTFLTVIPSKIFEAAAVRKPILLGLEGETKGIIEKYGAGICFLPEDENSFMRAVESMVSNKDSYISYQKGCAKMAVDFDRKKIALKMLAKLNQISKIE